MKKSFFAAMLFIGLFFVLSAGTYNATPATEGFENLKVLPKDITKEKLDSVMANWSISLGVRCNFCHGISPCVTGALSFRGPSRFPSGTKSAEWRLPLRKEAVQTWSGSAAIPFARHPRIRSEESMQIKAQAKHSS